MPLTHMSLDPESVPFLRSCERCRQKKRKCSGDKPACAWCSSHSVPCRYRRTARFKKQLEGYPGQLISALDAPAPLASIRSKSWTQPAASEPQAWPAPQLPQAGPVLPPQIESQGDANTLSADDFARLFSVDMVPKSSTLPPDFLQIANSFITPFSGTSQLPVPDWMTMTNADASMLANLGDLAALGQASVPQDWVPLGAAGSQKGRVDGLTHGFLSDEPTFPFGAELSSLGIDDLLSSLSGSNGFAAGDSPAMSQGFVSGPSTAFSGTAPATDRALYGADSDYQRLSSAPGSSARDSSVPSQVTEPDVPPIIQAYVSAIPGNVSPTAIYRIMRETFKAPRTGMVSLNLELVWFMLHKGVLPRIAFYGHLSSTIRCSVVANLNIKSMVPSNLDESCYELALNEAPLIKDCAAIWGAIGLCMLARYEFQSLRYQEMAMHADMAMDVMHRIVYAGRRYPWHDVSPSDKESFGFQYLLAIHWKVFLWKLLSLMLINHDMAFKSGLEGLPDYSSKTFDLYTMDTPYDVDLMEMIPQSSWFGASAGQQQPNIRFRGPSDPEFMRLRPENSPCFNRGSTNGLYIQQLLVIFARVLAMQDQVRRGQIGVGKLLNSLWTFKERMQIWRNALPSELVVNNRMVAGYLDSIRAESQMSPAEIDLRAARLKDAIILFMTYHSFIIRANRFAMKAMLGEPLDMPPPDVSTAAFNIRDLFDSTASPQAVREYIGDMNLTFHVCRVDALKSADALCNLVQAVYACKFNFYTLGSTVVFSICDLLVTDISLLKNRDVNIAWRAKSRLTNVFNILRILRHWAPALNMFVAGFKALSDPKLCIDEPRNIVAYQHETMNLAMVKAHQPPIGSNGNDDDSYDDGRGDDDMESMLDRKRRKVAAGPVEDPEYVSDADMVASSASHRALSASASGGVKRDETLSYHAAEPIPEFANPFPPTHAVSLIAKDLGLSLAEFLAPAYPIL
ncbi:hypothetical protein GGH95_000495, partial [Coemansia sp. RSA 1836]